MSVVTVLSFRLWRPVLQGLGAESFCMLIVTMPPCQVLLE